jgi:protocatechuate 3,4-dioxygenase beta subunit
VTPGAEPDPGGPDVGTEPVSEPMAAMLSTCATSRQWAEQDEGPYHRDAQPLRRDITDDRDGVPLELGIRLEHEDGSPVTGATVEVWHCDALGRYSGFPPPDDSTLVGATDAPRDAHRPEQRFLRGRQRTDAAGMVELRSIHPGWYPGRTVHVHVMAHVGDATLITQLYFPEELNEQVLSVEPYARRPGRDTTNETDEIFAGTDGPPIVDVVPIGHGHRAAIRLTLPADALPA